MRDLPLAYLNPLFDVFKELRETYQDMTVAQALAFTAIASNPGIPMKQIEKITGLSDSSVSRICHILGDKGNRNTQPLHLVHAVPMPDDARVLTMHLTQRGRHLAQVLASTVASVPKTSKQLTKTKHLRGRITDVEDLLDGLVEFVDDDDLLYDEAEDGPTIPLKGIYAVDPAAKQAAHSALEKLLHALFEAPEKPNTPKPQPQRKRSIEID